MPAVVLPPISSFAVKIAPHVLYASTVSGKEADYILNAHMDVVPATDDQFEPRIEGDLMLAQLRGEVSVGEVNAYGRGRLEKLFKKFFG